jgi:hypothetical protein
MKTLDYFCQFCLNPTTAEYEGFLSSSNILICERCGEGTHVDLSKPRDYAAEARIRRANDHDRVAEWDKES